MHITREGHENILSSIKKVVSAERILEKAGYAHSRAMYNMRTFREYYIDHMQEILCTKK